MGKLAGTGTVSGAIGGAAAVLAIAIFARTGTALEPQRASGAAPSASSAPPSPQTARPAVAPAARPAALVDFERDVQPILSENCLECHSQDKRKGGLSLATYGDVLDGGKDGAVVRPGPLVAQPDDRPGQGHRRRSHAARRAAVERRADRAPAAVDRSGRARDAHLRAGARALGGAARAPGSCAAGGRLAGMEPSCRSPRRLVSREVARAAADAGVGCDVRRRAYLDIWGLLPPPDELQAFVADTRARTSAIDSSRRCSPTTSKYAEHWISFWNDLLRNEDGVRRTSRRQNGRKSITDVADGGARRATCRTTSSSRSCSTRRSRAIPRGSSIGVNWRGETSAAVTPWMQASQNTAQVFLGVNFKCNACHDSFVSKWKLKDAYGARGLFLARAEAAAVSAATSRATSTPSRRSSIPSSGRAHAVVVARPIAARPPRRSSPIRATAACRGRSSTASGSGSSATASSPTRTRWTASRGVRRCSTGWPATSSRTSYDVKHLIATIMTSRAYQMPAVARTAEAAGARLRVPRPGGAAPHRGAVRRCDRLDHRRVEHVDRAAPVRDGRAAGRRLGNAAAVPAPIPTPATAGVYVRETGSSSSSS